MTRPRPSTALDHLVVLDLTRVRAGPTCCRVLADFGANVIKIEAPEGVDPNAGMSGARHGYDMQNLHRNKRSLTLNLKKPEGLAVFRRMVEQADVVVENFRPDVKTRLGIDYDALAAVNPRIILASISGFGQTGPYAKRAGFDQIAQGHGRAHDGDGASGARDPCAPVHCGGGFDRWLPCRAGHPGGAGGAREVGQGAMGALLAAGGADRYHGLPGRALSGRGRGPSAGGQRPSLCHAHGGDRDPGRVHQSGCGGGRAMAQPLHRDRDAKT